ncbi:hypothetical protein E6P09_01535 [Haloferax mediterranei ATCC 33500]|uniref:DUF7573 domain-containing protein n=1 Tax=Haloferax mediterranei (strain ATCC 33500 / DSM 1411 / JCM 8866 / NBRC 14739 / NCIMB 2177 / R-4) TaxID=523841 RepID=I3R664_HALMT|nr:zinc ribbon domain-containing protein [Haloferax mediterranei]AFK19724.1 hypothetical protein HFX_2032 [Haloferax mediterranei ATCC 33500]AHZ23112.1 hypothetical protein BM92_10905 [Haloferax mediterranei ATCC 33500]EMA00046.1 hypothetical protein C439_11938 [Haloferax mediterranei ATCC 33500]MDX5987531.1 zinc ribbon domain-containing protein [Haloferax mediterranei ATCC 33500]QCQ76553.1 hypothetical protein E6P09_01535 [Haloferax mediterranei ATCC 33500]
MPNRSLDDYFAEDDEETESTELSTADTDGEDDAEADSESDTVADMGSDTKGDAEADSENSVHTLATYRWNPDGTPCPQCGESVEKRWLDGDEYVCIDCKDW